MIFMRNYWGTGSWTAPITSLNTTLCTWWTKNSQINLKRIWNISWDFDKNWNKTLKILSAIYQHPIPSFNNGSIIYKSFFRRLSSRIRSACLWTSSAILWCCSKWWRPRFLGKLTHKLIGSKPISKIKMILRKFLIYYILMWFLCSAGFKVSVAKSMTVKDCWSLKISIFPPFRTWKIFNMN